VLRQALEQCATYFHVSPSGEVSVADAFLRPKLAHYNYDFFFGIEYEFDLNRPAGRRVTRLARGGRALAEDDRLTLVMNSYRATGSGDFECYLGCPRVREGQTEVSELILNYLRAGRWWKSPKARPSGSGCRSSGRCVRRRLPPAPSPATRTEYGPSPPPSR
jgi:2',3'-cyclic-nucleotide 2'-phosphodiesterase/3'-nucleotidase